ncbi:MAG TPA: hypothetical protein PLC40_14895, partial [Candidatus Hydrogenedentes bacterium]|nr:hypothetical protein [Candidatus Hydrogenedentota bacterium]
MTPPLNSLEVFKTFQQHLANGRKADHRTIVVSAGACGLASGAQKLIEALQAEMHDEDSAARVAVRVTGCHGFCELEPSLLVEPEGTFYPRVAVKQVSRLVKAVACGEVINDLLWTDPDTGKSVARMEDLPFYSKQVRKIMGRNEKIDPVRVESYIENGGYAALVKVVEKGNPDWVVEEVVRSGLRG